MTSPQTPGFLDTTEIDFGGVRDSLVAFLRQQDRFKDYNFEGSNLRVLIDLLAYNTHLQAQYLHMVGSEMFLDTAQLRESVVSHAKELNYVPRSKSSAVAYINAVVVANTGPTLPETVVVPRYFPLRAIVDGTQYTFTTSDVHVARRSSGYQLNDIPVYEGLVTNEFFIVSSTPSTDRFLISSPDVDTSSIRVQVQESSTSNVTTEWTAATSLLGLGPDSLVFFVQGAEDNRYEITFGNGVTGKALQPGNVVKITYRATKGEEANTIAQLEPLSTVEGYNFVITEVVPAQFGQDRESIEDIKFYAPKFFTTQDRAVTQNDFIVLLRSKFPGLEAVTAYGGETITPPAYGKVVISAKPFGGTVLPQSNKRAILEFLKSRASLAIDPIFSDPDFMYVGVTSNIRYNANRTTQSAADIQSAVVSAVDQFGTSNLNQFNSKLRYSRLIASIDAAAPSIVSNDTNLTLIKHWSPAIRTPVSLQVAYNNAIDTLSTSPSVFSTPFNVLFENVVLLARVEDDRRGNLQLVYTSNSNERVVLLNNIGTVNYSAGAVAINSIVIDQYAGSRIDVHVRPAQRDVSTSKNQILLVSTSDVFVTAQAVRE